MTVVREGVGAIDGGAIDGGAIDGRAIDDGAAGTVEGITGDASGKL
jgi:hypothetical protein